MLLTEEQYLHLEREAETKREFHDGQMFAMPALTVNHSLLTSTIGALLYNRVPSGCRVFDAGLRIKVAAAGFTIRGLHCDLRRSTMRR